MLKLAPIVLQNQSLHSVAQPQCCLEQRRCMATRQTLIRRMCLPLHIYTIQALAAVVSSIDFFLVTAISRSTSYRSDPSHLGHGTLHEYCPYYPTTPAHYRMGIHFIGRRRILGISHSSCQPGIVHQRRQLLLPSLNTEEMVKFLMIKENEEKSPKGQ